MKIYLPLLLAVVGTVTSGTASAQTDDKITLQYTVDQFVDPTKPKPSADRFFSRFLKNEKFQTLLNQRFTVSTMDVDFVCTHTLSPETVANRSSANIQDFFTVEFAHSSVAAWSRLLDAAIGESVGSRVGELHEELLAGYVDLLITPDYLKAIRSQLWGRQLVQLIQPDQIERILLTWSIPEKQTFVDILRRVKDRARFRPDEFRTQAQEWVAAYQAIVPTRAFRDPLPRLAAFFEEIIEVEGVTFPK